MKPGAFLACQGLGFYARVQVVGTAIDVFETFDVVLTQVAARLHFDDFQRDLAWVFQAMDRRDRDVGGLVFGEQEHILIAGNLSRDA